MDLSIGDIGLVGRGKGWRTRSARLGHVVPWWNERKEDVWVRRPKGLNHFMRMVCVVPWKVAVEDATLMKWQATIVPKKAKADWVGVKRRVDKMMEISKVPSTLRSLVPAGLFFGMTHPFLSFFSFLE